MVASLDGSLGTRSAGSDHRKVTKEKRKSCIPRGPEEGRLLWKFYREERDTVQK